MKVRVRDRRVPADHNVAADLDLQFAQQHHAGEVTKIANPNASAFSRGKMHAIHRAVRADDQGVGCTTVKTFEGQLIGDERVDADLCVWWQSAFRPATGLGVLLSHVSQGFGYFAYCKSPRKARLAPTILFPCRSRRSGQLSTRQSDPPNGRWISDAR